MPALELIDVTRSYPAGDDEIVALDSASLTVADNEMVTLIGPSGSGKTTLLSIAGGLLSPTSGTVRVGDDDISEMRMRELTKFRSARIGFVFQSVNLVPFLTARENLLVVPEMSGRRSGEAKKRADTLLDELGLGERRGNLPDQLSGGERQRVAIGRALMNEPDLVLFDEPTSALDSKLGEQVMKLIRNEVKSRRTAAIIVTHDLRIVDYGDRTEKIVDGRLQSNGSSESEGSLTGDHATSPGGVAHPQALG